MNTTAGSFALLGSVVPDDAGVIKRLRKAGAIILGIVPHSLYYVVSQTRHYSRQGQSVGVCRVSWKPSFWMVRTRRTSTLR